METVKAKIKGTNAILEGCVCDNSFFVSVDHDTFERYNLDEVEICKDSLQVPETCKENQDSFTSLEDAAVRWNAKNGLQVSELINRDIRDAFIAGSEWKKEQMMKDAVEGYVTFNRDAQEEGLPCVTVIANEKPMEFYESCGFKLGDKVKIIIVKQ